MVAASALFALMGLCVKLAAAHYPAPDMVLYRSLIGALIVCGQTYYQTKKIVDLDKLKNSIKQLLLKIFIKNLNL